MSPDKDKDKDRPTGEGDEQQDEGSGLTEEFEAQFGEDFGADVADEMAMEEDEDAEEVEEDEDADAEAEAGGEEHDEDDAEDLDDDDEDGHEDEAAAAERDPLEVLSEETVEADVLALADEEEEREQAEREAAAALEAHVVQETGEGPATGESPPPTGEEDAVEDDTPPKPGLLPRFMAASLVVIIAMATATSVSILLYFTKIAKGLGGLENLQDQLVKVEPGKPQTILIMGSDRRPELEETGRSDTTMLLRLDPDNEAIALLSLPRDLKVNIPGRGIAKLNEAYTLGGPELTTEVVQNLTGLEINHAVNVDFEGFEKAINAIDCVYVDVDRQYFHSNEGLASTELFSEIDIQAGYQLLCGDRALQYVRYRHTDNDIVRSARQQDFLREARQKIGPGRLFRDREELIEIFTDYTTSDIEDPFVLSEVVKLFLASADAPIKQVHFEGELGTAYVTASSDQIKTAVDQFLGIKDTPGGLADEGGGGKKKPKPDKPKKEPKEQKPVAPALIDVTGAGLAYAEKYAPAVGFPVEYPTKLVPGSQIISESREYKIADEDKGIHRAYKLVFSLPGTSVPLEFYGLMGTTWLDPPILDNPSETRTIDGREYDLFFDGDRLRMIAWRTDEGAYWLSNTLLQTLDEDEMIAIADSMAELSPPKKKKKK